MKVREIVIRLRFFSGVARSVVLYASFAGPLRRDGRADVQRIIIRFGAALKETAARLTE
jgi:hypothetical protein